MCLFATTQKALVAKEDIEVYKIVLVRNGKYYTPYRDILLSERPKCTKITVTSTYCGYYVVEGEGIHAYTSKEEAENDAKTFFKCFNYRVIKGTIPKGTRYWKSIPKRPEVAAKYIDFGLKEYKENWFKRLIRKMFKV